jgi:hypothetical protein
MDRLDEALQFLRDAHARAPRSVAARRNLALALLRTGAAAEARALLEGLLAQFPDDQLLIAQRATALRLLGDPEYRRLYDYPRVVRTFALQPPARFADIAAFNAAFARELTALHRATQHPLEQSLRGGSQTERHLPRDVPLFADFFAMLDAPIRDYLAALHAGDASHPLDRRGATITGSPVLVCAAACRRLPHRPRASARLAELGVLRIAAGRGGRGLARRWLKFGEPEYAFPGADPSTRPARRRHAGAVSRPTCGTAPCRSPPAVRGSPPRSTWSGLTTGLLRQRLGRQHLGSVPSCRDIRGAGRCPAATSERRALFARELELGVAAVGEAGLQCLAARTCAASRGSAAAWRRGWRHPPRRSRGCCRRR